MKHVVLRELRPVNPQTGWWSDSVLLNELESPRPLQGLVDRIEVGIVVSANPGACGKYWLTWDIENIYSCCGRLHQEFGRPRSDRGPMEKSTPSAENRSLDLSRMLYSMRDVHSEYTLLSTPLLDQSYAALSQCPNPRRKKALETWVRQTSQRPSYDFQLNTRSYSTYETTPESYITIPQSSILGSCPTASPSRPPCTHSCSLIIFRDPAMHLGTKIPGCNSLEYNTE